MRRIAGAVVVAAIVIVLAMVFGSRTGPRVVGQTVVPSKAFTTSPEGALSPDAVLAIAPRGAAPSPTATAFTFSADEREFYARNFGSLYARLSKGPRTPEGNWILARILENCAMIPDEAPRGAAWPIKEVVDARRAKLAAALSPSDPDRQKRLDALDAAMRNPCDGLAQLKTTRAEIDQLYRDAAAAGDAKARLALVREDIRAQFRDRNQPNGSGFTPKLDNDQMAVIRQSLASSDPTTAMEVAEGLSFFASSNVSLRDRDGKPVELGALLSAATLIACDAGYPCGPDASEMTSPCAYTGRCDASTLRDYLLYYGKSPYDSQLIARYESALRNAAATGDPSFFEFYPAPSPSVAPFQFQ